MFLLTVEMDTWTTKYLYLISIIPILNNIQTYNINTVKIYN